MDRTDPRGSWSIGGRWEQAGYERVEDDVDLGSGRAGAESCVAQAKAAAGGRDILLHGAATAQECLRAALLDEMGYT